jgi:hypothetical protein
MGRSGHVLADHGEQSEYQTIDLGKAFIHGSTVLPST